MRIRDEEEVHRCRRCGWDVSPSEYGRSTTVFQRIFCDPRFDEDFLERRNFDTKVELNLSIR